MKSSASPVPSVCSPASWSSSLGADGVRFLLGRSSRFSCTMQLVVFISSRSLLAENFAFTLAPYSVLTAYPLDDRWRSSLFGPAATGPGRSTRLPRTTPSFVLACPLSIIAVQRWPARVLHRDSRAWAYVRTWRSGPSARRVFIPWIYGGLPRPAGSDARRRRVCGRGQPPPARRPPWLS